MYRLFALRSSVATLDKLENERFVRANARYTLVLTKTEELNDDTVFTTSGLAAEVKAGDLNRLTTADRQWLSDCLSALLYEEMKAKEPEVSEKIGEQIKVLEEALKEQREKDRRNSQ